MAACAGVREAPLAESPDPDVAAAAGIVETNGLDVAERGPAMFHGGRLGGQRLQGAVFDVLQIVQAQLAQRSLDHGAAGRLQVGLAVGEFHELRRERLTRQRGPGANARHVGAGARGGRSRGTLRRGDLGRNGWRRAAAGSWLMTNC